MTKTVHSATIDPSRPASHQLRELAKHYNELAKLLDELTSDPKRQCEILAEIIEQDQQSHAA